jgi:hypothetical protein
MSPCQKIVCIEFEGGNISAVKSKDNKIIEI